MTTIDLEFAFKGARKYIHGTDMLNIAMEAVLPLFPAGVRDIDLVIHRMVGRNLALETVDGNGSPNTEGRVATLKIRSEGVVHQFQMHEKHDQPINRYPYDEDVVANVCALDNLNKTILLKEDAPYTVVETIVAMTKLLHLSLFPSETGKWVFCHWSSTQWPIPGSIRGTSVTLKQKLGTKLTRSEITLNGHVIGSIGFSARGEK